MDQVRESRFSTICSSMDIHKYCFHSQILFKKCRVTNARVSLYLLLTAATRAICSNFHAQPSRCPTWGPGKIEKTGDSTIGTCAWPAMRNGTISLSLSYSLSFLPLRFSLRFLSRLTSQDIRFPAWAETVIWGDQHLLPESIADLHKCPQTKLNDNKVSSTVLMCIAHQAFECQSAF